MNFRDMVLHKRLDYGSIGYKVPAIQHVPKSAKGKRSARKKVVEHKMRAFDLLATIAGQLLTEGKCFSIPCSVTETSFPTAGNDIVSKEQSIRQNSIKTEILDQHSCSDSLLDSEVVTQRDVDYEIKEQSHSSEILTSCSAPVKVDISNKDIIANESRVFGHGSEAGYLSGATQENCDSERHHCSFMESHKYKEVVKTPTREEGSMEGTVMALNAVDLFNLEYPVDLATKSPALVNSDSSAGPACSSKLPQNSSFPKRDNGLEFAIDKDDDENFPGCTHPSIHINKPSRLQRIGDRRIRKLLASKYWNASPTVSHESGISDVEIKPVFSAKQMCYMRQRARRGSFKRKKLLERCPVPNGGKYGKSVSNLHERPGIKIDQSDPNATLHGVNGASSPLTGPKSSGQSAEYSVKLSISSFNIPELFIEMPETATVGSLKRTIMEAATAILGGGLRLGVLLQGKKVRDDNKTLRQAGILNGEKLDNLGIMLEPDGTHVSASLTTSKDPHLSNLAASDGLSARIAPITTDPIEEVDTDVTPQPLLTISPESDRDSVYSSSSASCLDKITGKTLVVIPPINADAMAVVPLCKSRRSEVVQRRIRRPFSVAEVEALVQAVEKLGTGRWRDVKLRAFDNAKHRTYVDLKDKWKTLVHTAKISPQQRRGEPVPQDLLDRVLAAHAFWSQQQAKLQVKPPAAESCLLI